MSQRFVLAPDAFGDYIEQELAGLSWVTIIDRNGLDLRIRVNQVGLSLGLQNFYTTYNTDPESLDAIVTTLINALQQDWKPHEPRSFDALKAKIFPMLKNVGLLTTIQERRIPMLVYRLFLADVMITYVIDEGESVSFINEDHTEQWGVDEQEIYAVALENLRQRTQESVDYTSAGSGIQKIFIYNSQDGYDATRILLSEILHQWQKQLDGRIVIGIPNRDFLIACGDADQMILTNIAQQIQRDMAERPYGLSSNLFTLANNEVRVYEWE